MPEPSIAAVTGAAGHLGEALVRELLAQGHDVRALVRTNRGALEGTGAKLVAVDLLDPSSLAAALDGVDVVYNLAAVISLHGDPDGLVWKTNVDGAYNVAQAALEAGAQRLVHCSSIQAFIPSPDEDIILESHDRATAEHFPIYDRSKAVGEERVLDVAAKGLHTVICNPTSVLGPFDFKPSRSGQLLLALARNLVPALPPGSQNWVDVRDIATGLRLAAEHGRSGSNYILGGHHLSLLELADYAANVTGARKPLRCPMLLARLGTVLADIVSTISNRDLLVSSGAMEALTLRTRVSYEKARDELGYAPRPMSETIADTYQFFHRQGSMPKSREPKHG